MVKCTKVSYRKRKMQLECDGGRRHIGGFLENQDGYNFNK